MDSKETASCYVSVPTAGSSLSSSSYDTDTAAYTVSKTNVLNDDSSTLSRKDGISDYVGIEIGQEAIKEDNSGDPSVGSVNNEQKVDKHGVLVGREVVEGDIISVARVEPENCDNIDEGGEDGSIGRTEPENSDNAEKVSEITVLDGGEVVEEDIIGAVAKIESEKGDSIDEGGEDGSIGRTEREKSDNAEKVSEIRVLDGGEVVGRVKNGYINGVELNSVDSKVTGIDGAESTREVPVNAENSGSSSSEKVDERGDEVVKSSGGNEGKENTRFNDGVLEVKDEEAEDVEKIGTLEGETITTAPFDEEGTKAIEKSAESGDIENLNVEEVGTENRELVLGVGLKLTSQGDSIVEGIDVELSEPGVVVVREVGDGRNVQSTELEVLANESVELVSGNDVSSPLSEKVANSGATEVDVQISEPATDHNGETSESNPTEQITEVAMVGKQDIDEEPVVTDLLVDKFQKNMDDDPAGIDAAPELNNMEEKPEMEIEQEAACQTKANGPMEEGELGDSISDEESEGVIFGSSEAANQFIEELERGAGDGSHSGAGSSRDNSQRIDDQIVTDTDEEGDSDEEGDGRELFDSAALAALLKAATGADSDGGNITITSQDGSRLFSVERPAGLGSSVRSLRPTLGSNHPNLFTPTLSSNTVSENNLSEEEKKKLEKLQNIRVKYLRLLQRLGVSTEESIVNQVLYRLALVAGKQNNQLFNMEAAKTKALQLEAEGKDDLDFSVNILVLGKCGVGKSATINSILGEEKAAIDAFEPATSTVKEISGFVDGVKILFFDTPGLRPSVIEQAFNRSVLSCVKKFTKKSPPDIVLYVDRVDAPTRDLNDLPMLKIITSSLGSSIWRNAIVTLTHAASAPPDGPSGSPLSYEMFVTQRSHVIQQSIGQAVGDLRMMSPNLMNPVSLVENHPSCRKNREGQKILPNGQSWRPQSLLLCYSIKILSEASSLSKPQDPFDHRKLFGFRARSPPLPYILSSMLQSRTHPKLSAEQGGENADSDVDLDDLSDSDQEEEEEYDQLPPFKPLKKAQLAKLSHEQRKAYFEEYDYRVKLLQKKQWREELRRMREMKKKGKDAAIDYGYAEEDADSGAAAPVAVPLPDMALPPSFGSDYPAYRYRFLEPTSQFIARPVLDTHGWDHDCGYDGVNLEHSLAIASRFPASYTIQITKDKKDFTINLDSSISAKHGENGSSMAVFDIQNVGKQLAYIVRGETKFKNLKKNKTAGGISITFLGDNVVPGIKLEDQIILGKQYVLTGSAGAVRSQHDTAYGANFELQRREQDYPIGQVQSTLSMSLIKWRGDLALGFNGLAQFAIGRSSKVAVRAGINNKLSGQITVRTSSSEHLSLALAGIIPTAIAIYKKFQPHAAETYAIY